MLHSLKCLITYLAIIRIPNTRTVEASCSDFLFVLSPYMSDVLSVALKLFDFLFLYPRPTVGVLERWKLVTSVITKETLARAHNTP